MAKMNGVNSTIRNTPAGKGRHNPASFNRVQPGVNARMESKQSMGKHLPIAKQSFGHK